MLGLDRLVGWQRDRWVTAGASFMLFTAVAGLQTGLIPNVLSMRMVPAATWMWPALVLAMALTALLLASYLDAPGGGRGAGWLGGSGCFLALLAVSCPSCNVVAIALLGQDGALRWWGPAQPMAAAVALALLTWALRVRLVVR
jgi:hypothetical protein